MKVLVVTSMIPFVSQDEALATRLVKNLVHIGHEAEILRIPYQPHAKTHHAQCGEAIQTQCGRRARHDGKAEAIVSQMLMVRAMELSYVDHVIALKFPAYLIRHPKKTLWLDELVAYEEAHHDDAQLFQLIKNASQESFAESLHIFVHSESIGTKLIAYNGCKASVLAPPLNERDKRWSNILDTLLS